MEGFVIFLLIVLVFVLGGLNFYRKILMGDRVFPPSPQAPVRYFIKPAGEDRFDLSLSVPSDYPVDITDFELWADGRIIGPKTSVIDEMRGVIIPRTAGQDMHIRLYNFTIVKADCPIDPEKASGELVITTAA